MANYDSNYAIAQQISARLGNEPIPFDSVYSICLQIYQELGGVEQNFDSVYSILLEILPLVDGGISSKVIDDSVISLSKTWSSSKISSELVNIPQLEAGQNISIDASNAISADGYVYNEANKTFLNVVKMTSSSLINKYSENGNKIGEGITESCAFGSRNVIQTSASHQEGETSSMNYAFGKGNTILGTRLTNIVCGTGNTLYGGNTAAVFGVGNYLAENVDRTNEVVVGLKLNATNTQEVALGLNNVSHTGTNNNEKTNLSIGTGVYLSSSNETHENLVETMKNGDIYIKGVGGYDGVHIKSETGYENTKTLQEYIAALEAKLAEYESRIAALEGNTTVE